MEILSNMYDSLAVLLRNYFEDFKNQYEYTKRFVILSVLSVKLKSNACLFAA